jgi:hypothetical protein
VLYSVLTINALLQYDYTKGQLPELIDVIIEEKVTLFVCAIGVPPKEVVEKLHKAGIPIMNVSSSTHITVRKLNIPHRWSDTPNTSPKHSQRVLISYALKLARAAGTPETSPPPSSSLHASTP